MKLHYHIITLSMLIVGHCSAMFDKDTIAAAEKGYSIQFNHYLSLRKGPNPNLDVSYKSNDSEKSYTMPLIVYIAKNFKESLNTKVKDEAFADLDYQKTGMPQFQNYPQCIATLCKKEHATNLNAKSSNGNTALHLLLKKPLKKNEKGRLGWQLEHTIKLLLGNGASVLIKNKSKETAVTLVKKGHELCNSNQVEESSWGITINPFSSTLRPMPDCLKAWKDLEKLIEKIAKEETRNQKNH